MSYTVYGLRLKGEKEPRYVGMTRRPTEYRLQRHCSYALTRTGPFPEWLNENFRNIEVVPLAKSADREVAKATEKLAILLFLAAGQSLFNQAHVPGVSPPRRPRRAT
jgi:hypothetical protein